MTATIDRAPFANDGDLFKVMAPKGMSFSLATEDITGARPTPNIRTYLHPEDKDKNFPDTWLPPEFYEKKRPNRRLITDRMVNPLDPAYKIPQGEDRIPAGDWIFSNRVTDLMDTTDIWGSKPRLLYKGPVRVPIEDIVFDRKAHPARRFFERLRCPVGTGLDLHDIDIGKRRFGFDRQPVSNPLEPLYPHEMFETDEQKFKRLKKGTIAPRQRFWYYGDPVLDKVLQKLYWKPKQLADLCNMQIDFDMTERVSYEELRWGLEEFGVKLTDEEFNRLIPYADPERAGSVKYLKFSKGLRWPSGFEKITTKRIGQDQWEGLYGNLGQGLMVMDEEYKTGKKMMPGAEAKYHLVNVINGEPLLKDGATLVPPREMLCLSYGEQLAQDANTKRDLNFKDFLPEPPASARVVPDVKEITTAEGAQTRKRYARAATPAREESPEPAAEPAPVRRSFMSSPPPRKLSSEAPPPEGPPLVEGATAEPSPTVAPEEPKIKLPVTARKTLAPAGGYYGLSTYEMMSRQARTKKLSPPTFKRRIRQEQRSADVESVNYLG